MKSIDELTYEQKLKLSQCETAEDLFALVKEGSFELTNEELALIAGGEGEDMEDYAQKYQEWSKNSDEGHAKGECPKCGSKNLKSGNGVFSSMLYTCQECGYVF